MTTIRSHLSAASHRASTLVLAICLLVFWIAAEAATIPPGVPEPGLVVWGTVVNQTNNQPISISSVSWSVTDSSNSAIYSSASIPATRIVNLNGQSFYILQVPFDTRQLGTVTLADPATVGINSFVLRSSSPPTYTLVPTINGALATVRSIDGAPASGGTVPVAGFTSATRGRVIRVDLAIIPVGTDYDAWASGYFGSASHPDAARTADPDSDGMNNDREFASGTDPKNPGSVLRVLTLTVFPTETVVGWLSVTNRNYLVERAFNANGPWSNASPVVPGSSPVTQRTVPAAGQGPEFFRVRVMAQ